MCGVQAGWQLLRHRTSVGLTDRGLVADRLASRDAVREAACERRSRKQIELYELTAHSAASERQRGRRATAVRRDRPHQLSADAFKRLVSRASGDAMAIPALTLLEAKQPRARHNAGWVRLCFKQIQAESQRVCMQQVSWQCQH
jgi:hypothetical protein